MELKSWTFYIFPPKGINLSSVGRAIIALKSRSMCGLPLEGPSPSFPSLTRLPPAPALLRDPLSLLISLSARRPLPFPTPAKALFLLRLWHRHRLSSLLSLPSPPSLLSLPSLPSLLSIRRDTAAPSPSPFRFLSGTPTPSPFPSPSPAPALSPLPSFLRRLPLPLSFLIRLRSRSASLSGPALSLSLTLSLSLFVPTLSLSRSLPVQERAYMKLRMSGSDDSDYGSSETGRRR